MRKQKSKAKVEVVEPKSVANKCDYCRTNGKCGRALSEMFGKLCPGRSCEDWKCEAEDGHDGEDAASGYLQSVATQRCRNDGGTGVCDDHVSNGGKKFCIDCEKVVKKTSTAVVPASATQRDAAGTVSTYRERVSGQYAAIETAKDNLLRECVKFGALLTEVGYYLGESRGGRHDGGGLKGWLAENCPEINYDTACGYKALATKCVKMLGGGSQAVAVLQDKTEVIPPGEDAPVEVESKFIEKRDNLFNEVKSRRELEQTYFKFMAHEGKGRQGGANKGQPGTGRRALTALEKADEADKELRELVGKIIAFDKSGKFRMLTAQTQNDIILYLKDCVRSFEEQQMG